MTRGVIEFEQTGVMDEKENRVVAWSIDSDENTIEVEHSEGTDWTSKGRITVETVDFVSQEFNQDDRWVVLQYTNEGKEYQLVVEGPKSMKGHTIYETRIENLNKTNTLVDKCYVAEIPKFRRRDV